MKIHDVLALVLADKQGKLFSYQQIRELVQAHNPDLKETSILPGEHTGKAGPKACQACKQYPLLKRQGHGLYRVLEQPSAHLHLSSHEKLNAVLQAHIGEILSIGQMRELVKQTYPKTHLGSIQPRDHLQGGGACRECLKRPLLATTAQRGYYQVLGGGAPLPASTKSRVSGLSCCYHSGLACGTGLRKPVRPSG